MSGSRKPPKGWTRWPREDGPGWSFRLGDLRAECFPTKRHGTLITHVVEAWRASDPTNSRREVVVAPEHWSAMDEFEVWRAEHSARMTGRFGP